ncbi:uncharacterized protein PGTG_13144 [Puccinia graminis f. sp. tritici CRL 75-36-700-3]|uniref:Uncharacterized protein n=1 Tax=Puccinia graminis f. sp. tritici (strain CRL 75-36-700-3 / race SCCL) TaxID=418459 RepID=E3KR37_PUCGT|nr:uncharacterized protein PGTG_13144 [Puccinia graminis f. sp. tritici CRL 75-36-700-3]EFP86762.1 hypothetical protein PGTG_13144 [Puccinia graminis f. sp. tritici CRL 75-36-700-3]
MTIHGHCISLEIGHLNISSEEWGLKRHVYNAYAKEHSIFYLLYFDIPSMGLAGLINMIAAFGRGRIFTGFFEVIATVGWAFLALGNAWMWKAVWKNWHDKGHTFNQAKSKFSTTGLKAYFSCGKRYAIRPKN